MFLKCRCCLRFIAGQGATYAKASADKEIYSNVNNEDRASKNFFIGSIVTMTIYISNLPNKGTGHPFGKQCKVSLY